jgi:uncharacterized protein YoxC
MQRFHAADLEAPVQNLHAEFEKLRTQFASVFDKVNGVEPDVHCIQQDMRSLRQRLQETGDNVHTLRNSMAVEADFREQQAAAQESRIRRLEQMVQDLSSGKMDAFRQQAAANESHLRRVAQTVQDLVGAVTDLGGRVGGLEYSNQQVVDLASPGSDGQVDFPRLLADTIGRVETNSHCIDKLRADLQVVAAV